MLHLTRLLVVLAAGTAGLALSACQPANVQSAATTPQATSEIAEVQTQLGIGYLRSGHLELAWQRLHKALEHDPNFSTAHNAMALLYQRLGQPDKAEEHFELAVQANPTDSSSQNNFGRFLCKAGRYPEAESRFLQAVKNALYDRREVAFSNAGECSRNAGDNEKAEAYLRSALEIDPRMPSALLTMADLSLDQEKFMSARAYFQRYTEVGAATARSLWLGIQIECELGDQNAISSYAMSLRNNHPDSWEAGLMGESCAQ